MEHKLYATTEYMEELCNKLKKRGQLWGWANIGWFNKKIMWRWKVKS